MYAPSSYNDTVTGETLSSVSEKSETYSNEGSNNDYVVSKQRTFLFCKTIQKNLKTVKDKLKLIHILFSKLNLNAQRAKFTTTMKFC